VTHSFPNIVITSSSSFSDTDLVSLETEVDEYIQEKLVELQPDWGLRALNVGAERLSNDADDTGSSSSRARLLGVATFAAPAPTRQEFWAFMRDLFTLDTAQDIWADATDIDVEGDTSSSSADSVTGNQVPEDRSVDASEAGSGADNTIVVATAMSGSALCVIGLVLAFRRRKKEEEDGFTDMSSKGPVVTLIPDVREMGVSATRSLSEKSSYDEDHDDSPRGLFINTDLSCVTEERESEMDDASRSVGRPPMLNVERMCDDESLASSEYTEIYSEQSVDAGSNSIKDLALGSHEASPVESDSDLLIDVGLDFEPPGDELDMDLDDDALLAPPILTPKPAHVLILADDGDVDLGASLVAHKWMQSAPNNTGDGDASSRSSCSSIGYHSDKECQVELSENGTVVVRPKGSAENTASLPSYQPDPNSGNVDRYFEQNTSLLSNSSSVTTAEDIVLLSGGTPMMDRAVDETEEDMLFENGENSSASNDKEENNSSPPGAIPMQILDEPDSPGKPLNQVEKDSRDEVQNNNDEDNNVLSSGDGSLNVNDANDENGMQDLPPATYSDSPPHRTRPLLERMSVPAAGRRRNHPSHRVWI